VLEDTKFAVCNKCGEFMSRGGESTKSYNNLRSQHPDEHNKFSKLKVKRKKERETDRKERGKALNIGGLCQLMYASWWRHGKSEAMG